VISPGWAWRARFLVSVLSGDHARQGPFCAAIDVTRRCNLQCFGCATHAPGSAWTSDAAHDDFAWDDFERVCRELRALGTRKMILIGQGEPLLHPRLPDMIAEAKRRGFHLALLTNGTLLDGRLAPAIAGSGLDELRVSLWAADEHEYARNYGGTSPKMFQRVIDGARLVSDARPAGRLRTPRIVLHRPIDREGFRGLDRMVALARAAGCDALSFSPLKPFGQAAVERGLSPDEVLDLREVLARTGRFAREAGLACNDAAVLRRYEIGNDVWKGLPCYMGWVDVRIRTNGDVLACAPCRTPLGNVGTSSLAEIWNGAAFRQFRRQTRTREGLAGLASDCCCDFCCHALTNDRLHRILRWLPQRSVPATGS